MLNKKTFFLIIFAFKAIFANSDNAEMVLEYSYETKYNKAFENIKNDSNACVLKGIVFVSRFDDLGDTLDLDSALNILKNCKASSFWEPMRLYEISLINSILGNTLTSIIDVRNAAKIFEKRSDLDSKAYYAVYAYYAPFTKFKLEDLKKGFEQSKMFSPVFGNSLVWIFYEEKKYKEALEIIETLLKKYPEHPVILQTKADMLFKLGNVKEAVNIYKQSEIYYTKKAPNSIRYWCSVANLAKMTNETFWKEKLKSNEYKKIKHWMPNI